MQGTDPERQSVHPAGEATFPEPLRGAPGISRSWQHGPQRGDRPEVLAISPADWAQLNQCLITGQKPPRRSQIRKCGAPGRIRTLDPQIRRKMVVSDRRFERIYDFRETSGETQAQDRFRGHRIKRGGKKAESLRRSEPH